jgi:hypothetical protein
MDELVTNGVILAESCVALGGETRGRAERFFAWCAETSDEPLALALLLIVRASAAPNDPRLAPLASAIDWAAVADAVNGSMRADLWRELAAPVHALSASR